ncbi:MAG: ComEC/Rec2 family competence protein [Acidobacteriota bacterium]|nr:ComEC/Rec2 family competence protein [Acidobacteriota bacterium]
MQHTTRAQPFAAYPLAQLAAGSALGILGAQFFASPIPLLVTLAGLTTLLAAVALIRGKNGLATTFVFFSMLLAGGSLASIEKSNVPINQLRRLLTEGTIAVGEPVELTGVLARDPEVAPQRLYIFLRVEILRLKGVEREAAGEVLLFAPISEKSIEQEFDRLDLQYGARIRVMTTLERTDSFRNPGVSTFTEYLDRKGYDATGFVKSPLLLERLGNEPVVLPLAWLYEWRRRLQTEIDARFSTDTAGVLDAALLGNRYKLSRQTSERFREGGTFHVLVISGLHITFLGGLIFLISRRFVTSRSVQFVLSASVLWSYCIAVGADPSVVRAALMFTVVLLAPLLSRHASSLNAIGGAALALLVWRPVDLFDPSFQLTFVSVLAIVIFTWPLLQKMSAVGSWRPTRDTPYPPSCPDWFRSLCEILYWSEKEGRRELDRASYSYRLFKLPWAATLERVHLQRVLRYAFGAIVVSAGVQTVLLPFLVIYFHRLSMASFILNIGVSLMMAGVAITALAGLAIFQVSPAFAAPFIHIANSLNWLMIHSVDPFAKVGMASIRVPEYTGWPAVVYGLYYAPLAVLVVSLSRWNPLALPMTMTRKKRRLRIQRIASLALVCAIALILVHPLSAGRPDGKLRIDFLDVGQGDSALVTLPDGTTLLIDGGGRPGPFKQDKTSNLDTNIAFERETRSIGESVVSEYLWWRGLDRVDYILATHADADHIDGLNDVARNFSVRAALVARTPGRDPEYSKFSDTLSSRGIPVRAIGSGDVLQFHGATANVLWPPATSNLDAPSGNNESVVLSLRSGNRTFLLTGDIEMRGEDAIVRARNSLAADVVKIAHHGSQTSSTEAFIRATKPHFAVISVGQTSVFGHPNKDVVERWRASGAQVLTTGGSGTITFSTDGSDLNVETFVKKR